MKDKEKIFNISGVVKTYDEWVKTVNSLEHNTPSDKIKAIKTLDELKVGEECYSNGDVIRRVK